MIGLGVGGHREDGRGRMGLPRSRLRGEAQVHVEGFFVCSPFPFAPPGEKCQRKTFQGTHVTFVIGNMHLHLMYQRNRCAGGDVHLHLRDPAALVVGDVVGELQHLPLHVRAQSLHQDRASHP